MSENQKNSFNLFVNHLNFEIIEAPEEIQLELCEIQNDSKIKYIFQTRNLAEFYKYLNSSYPNSFLSLKKNALKILSMFGSTYLCEQLFSIMKLTKSIHRNQITDIHLNACLKVNISNNLSPDIDSLVKQIRCQAFNSQK